MTRFISTILLVLFAMCAAANATTIKSQDVIVLAAPSITDTYNDEIYAEIFDGIIEFDIGYANAIYGRDNVFILVDKATRPLFKGRVPESILITTEPLHIWMRDFTTVNPYSPVQFRYTPASFENHQPTADDIQAEFNRFVKQTLGQAFPQVVLGKQYLKLDGGNVVDNYEGRVVVTDRFLSDNKLSKKQAIQVLQKYAGATEVAIIPADDPVLAHSDGMVMFSDRDTLFVNEYEEPLHSAIMKELETAFPDIDIVEIESTWDESDPTSACGVNLNATVTTNYIYMPHFGDAVSDRALKKIQQYTDKHVIPVPSSTVCQLGGSVRCLSWQQSGRYGKQLLEVLSKRAEKSVAISK